MQEVHNPIGVGEAADVGSIAVVVPKRLRDGVELQSQGTAPTATLWQHHHRPPMAHDEFPPLAPDSEAALRAAHETHVANVLYDSVHSRRYLSAGIREAMKQACPDRHGSCKWDRLGYIADNLHAPPPPPPTRKQMEEALQHLIDMYGARVAGESTDEHLQTLQAGIAHYCEVQP